MNLKMYYGVGNMLFESDPFGVMCRPTGYLNKRGRARKS